MKILSCGAGMQSTALALMGCENALAARKEEFTEYCRRCGYSKHREPSNLTNRLYGF